MHEAQMHEDNCFITLTYEGDQYNQASLNYKHFQDFAKRLRYQLGPFRFFMGGEYGELYKRPHYHACLFGMQFPDRIPWRTMDTGHTLYTSKILSDLWTHGENNSIGEITYASAAYVAGYCTKKLTISNRTPSGPLEHAYTRINPHTLEIYQVEPEFGHMSLRPGIGSKWIEKYKTDAYGTQGERGHITDNNGSHIPVPKYYDQHLEQHFGLEYDQLQFEREKLAYENRHKSTPERNAAAEKIAYAKLNLRKSKLE